MITDRIGQHKRLLQVNHKYINMYDILGFFKIKTQEILKIFPSGEWKKKNILVRNCDGACSPIV